MAGGGILGAEELTVPWVEGVGHEGQEAAVIEARDRAMRRPSVEELGVRLRRQGTTYLSVCATLGWMALTLVLLVFVDPSGPDGPISTPFPWLRLDLLVHLLLFGVLGLLASVSVGMVAPSLKSRLGLLGAFGASAAWGGVTELLQLGVSYRSASFEDFMADAGGALTGALVGGAIRWGYAKRSRSDLPGHRPA